MRRKLKFITPALDALQRGGVVEFGRAGEGEWRVRLVAPAGDS